MREAFIGSEAVATGRLTPYALRSRFTAIYPDVYLPNDTEITAITRGRAAWLWSRRRGVLAGFSAAALHGAKWVSAHRPAEILYVNRHAPSGIRTHSDRVAEDEVQIVGGLPVTTPARTALDLACRCPPGEAVAAIDALAHATDLKLADVELVAQRYPGRRGSRRARATLELVDAGAESPRESWLRLLLIRAGFPRPQTQIPVYDEFGQLIARLDMGWEDIRVAAEYDGDHHRTSRRRFNDDIRRAEAVAELGWIDVRVTAQDTPGGIIRRVAAARARRERELFAKK
jgi:YD repeat-containing protein